MAIPKEIESDPDTSAKEIGVMVGIPGTIYLWTVSRFSTAYMEYYDGQWFAWRESYVTGRQKARNYKIIASGNTFGYVLQESKEYIDYISRERK